MQYLSLTGPNNFQMLNMRQELDKLLTFHIMNLVSFLCASEPMFTNLGQQRPLRFKTLRIKPLLNGQEHWILQGLHRVFATSSA